MSGRDAVVGVCEWLGALAVEGARAVTVADAEGRVAPLLATLGAREVATVPLGPPPHLEVALGERAADLLVLEGLERGEDPLAVLVACRRALRREGFLVVETSYLFQEGQARVALVSDGHAGGLRWRPSKRALEGMLQLVGFEVLGAIAVDASLAVLAQARRPSEIRRRAGRVALVHDQYMRYANYRERIDFDALEADRDAPSSVRFLGEPGDRRIYPAFYRPSSSFAASCASPEAPVRTLAVARSAWLHARSVLADARAVAATWRRPGSRASRGA